MAGSDPTRSPPSARYPRQPYTQQLPRTPTTPRTPKTPRTPGAPRAPRAPPRYDRTPIRRTVGGRAKDQQSQSAGAAAPLRTPSKRPPPISPRAPPRLPASLSLSSSSPSSPLTPSRYAARQLERLPPTPTPPSPLHPHWRREPGLGITGFGTRYNPNPGDGGSGRSSWREAADALQNDVAQQAGSGEEETDERVERLLASLRAAREGGRR
ncbi:hypothetical protein GGS23DRAFT_594941 [Durotheca rogersii]|uniref:uncharacterized protein n=1 Tax=Durotheca rogersii TaxID=419775 RepID=UPI00221E88A3|nr:uncharacterized protein GGS23DRAFT_594941 [Durotheca rogersii]KAI5865411.1 hypothetical protein GGS23DRAFT_594941 [Durotheca rogersii]